MFLFILGQTSRTEMVPSADPAMAPPTLLSSTRLLARLFLHLTLLLIPDMSHVPLHTVGYNHHNGERLSFSETAEDSGNSVGGLTFCSNKLSFFAWLFSCVLTSHKFHLVASPGTLQRCVFSLSDKLSTEWR